MNMVHGGPDALGIPVHDFSTNANACGPCPDVLAAVLHADRSRYPDPAYTALRARLAAFHGVAVGRIVVAASASEFIHRITAFAVRSGLRHATLPAHGYGDYARAAAVWGLTEAAGQPALHWACDPASPLGTADASLAEPLLPGSLRVIDCAYAPLRLEGEAAPLPPDAWQLWTPNKALGLTGVRAAYAIAPDAAQAEAVQALAPSWPLGADGVAMLGAWVDAQAWLAGSLATLRDWKAQQIALCTSLGWSVVPGSLANYFTARLPVANVFDSLRAHGIKLRDCASFGLPGHVRVGVLPPASQQALRAAWGRVV
ncbi:MAG: aminotransferase class I/II-fold pyridoxal phosphate-dependent enzyme [Acidovorax sp.]|uniref:aminotransferase class I/II-fold pyridoxal phosphate-dependent enzyme n=1 Tax=Acidovorax sp. TaxID=1872122 RepID=UPI0039E496B6